MPPIPLVTVVMPVYNAAAFVEESLRSVLEQTVSDVEVVVVDDGSTDGSPEVVRGVGDARVHLVRADHGGEGAARNIGLDRARGEFVVWQDADDVSLPQRLERLLSAFVPGIGFAHHDMLFVDAHGTATGYQRSANPRTEHLAQHILREGCPYSCATTMLRRSAVGATRHPEDMRIGVDVDFMRRFAPTTRGVHVPEPLTLYRKHETSALATARSDEEFAHVERLLAEVSPLELVDDARQDDWVADQDAVALAFAGLCLVRRRIARGSDLLEEAVARDLTTAAGSSAIAAVLELALEAPGRALAQLTRAPDNSMTRVLRGNAHALLHDLPAAAAEYRGALSLRPRSYDALEGLRSVCEEMDLWELDDPTRRLVRRYR